MPGTCDTCRFWRDGRWGNECDRLSGPCEPRDPKLLTSEQDAAIAADASDDSGLDARLITGPKFGCTLHETREEPRP